MAQTKLSAGVPSGYGKVTPFIVSRDSARVIAFMAAAFDAKEKEGSRTFNLDGSIAHVEVEVGDSVVMLFDAAKDWPETPGFVRVFVEDGDATFRRALDAGARSVTTMTELSFGDRVGRVADPCGNVWWIQEAAAKVPDDLEERARDPEITDAMQYVQESLDREVMRRRGMVLGPRGITVE